MFNLRNILNKLKGRIWHVKGKTYPPERVDELDLSKWGMGDVRPSILDGGTVVYPTQRPEDPRGGYGGLCIPGDDDLPDSIPRVPGPPTMEIREPFIGCEGRARIWIDPIERVEVSYDTPEIRSASITNGYDRDIVLESPMLRLHLKAGETRTIDGKVFQISRHPTRHEEAMIKGVTPFIVLRDMAAERTRSMLRNQNTESRDPDQVTVGRLLEISKFTVQEL